jgi:hypothetical protein
MQAAAAGFNVLYLDGDVAIQTMTDRVNGLKPDALARVEYLNIQDYVNDDGAYVPAMAKFFVSLTTEGVVTWNDTKGRMFHGQDYAVNFETNTPAGVPSLVTGGDRVIQIRPARLDMNTVVIIDSWTTLVTSIQAWKAGDLGIDLLDVEKMERDMYAGTAHKATQFLQLLRAFPCHLVVIGHPREYIKRSPKVGTVGPAKEQEMKIDWTRMVPMSTSNPHALTMGKNFSDIAWIELGAVGGKRFINMTPTNERVVGGHFEGREEVDKFSIGDLIQRIGAPAPKVDAPTDSWLTKYGPGEFVPAGKRPAPTLNTAPAGSLMQTTAPKGLAGLAGIKSKGVGGTK